MLRKTLSSLLLFCCASVALAQVSRAPDAQSPRIEQLLDVRSNLNMVRHPQRALDMADAMSEPELVMAAMLMSANPEVWLKALEQASKPGTYKNFAQLTDPQMLADWFYASIDPQFQQAILSRALDPKKSQRWMQAMSDPRFYMPALAMMSPATPMQWMKVSGDGRMIQSMQPWFDPKTYLDWTRLPMPSPASKHSDKATEPAALFMWKPLQRY